jgi:hypothetical protein
MVAMSRFLDERGRIFGKLNVVDILVFLVIVAVVVFAVVRLTGTESETKPLKITFTVKELRKSEAADLMKWLQPGMTLTDEGGTILGKVQSVGESPLMEEYLTSADVLQEFPSPIFSDVSIVVLGEGQVSGHSARIGSVSVLRFDKVVVLGATGKFTTLVTDLVWGPEALK